MGKKKLKDSATVIINDRYQFQIDPLNINLFQKRGQKEDGKEGGWSCEGHYSSLESALLSLLKHLAQDKLFAKQVVTLEEMKDIYLACQQEIKDIAKIEDVKALFEARQ